MPSYRRKRARPMPRLPASGEVTAPSAGTNRARRTARSPCRRKTARVPPTHESGWSETRQIRASARRP